MHITCMHIKDVYLHNTGLYCDINNSHSLYYIVFHCMY